MKKTSVIGIDFGTSGCRGVLLDQNSVVLAETSVPLPPSRQEGPLAEQTPEDWWSALEQLMSQLLPCLPDGKLDAIALDGTSGTVLLTDDKGTVCSPALMYNDNRAVAQASHIASIAPADCAAHGTGSGLAKALWLLEQADTAAPRIHTQADWLYGKLCGRFDISDANNALKLGYDPVEKKWPQWLQQLGIEQALLPEVVSPSTPITPLTFELAKRWELQSPPMICAGTTDSTAAFIASGASKPGDAVTSLGSTLVLKVISENPVFTPEYGVYSQPLGDLWLVGGGSNSGGAVLRHFFDDARMAELTRELKPDKPTGLDYYPLLTPGERFPVNDPSLAPRVEPRPDDEARFFQGLLEGIAQIEKRGYELLAELGAPYPTSVRSNGGGAANLSWTQIRGNLLGVPMLTAEQNEACYGTAKLALLGIHSAVG